MLPPWRPGEGRDADLAAERHDRDADAGQEFGAAAHAWDATDPERRIRELVGEEAEPRDARGPAPGGRLELEQVHLERVTGLRADDGDGAVDLVHPVEVEPGKVVDRRRCGQLPAGGVEEVEFDDGSGLDRFDRLDRRVPREVEAVA